MRTCVKDVPVDRWFMWRGLPYKKTSNVPWGALAYTKEFKEVWIGATALVECDIKVTWPLATKKRGRQ